jgi:flagellar biosynthesis anti-sigma factor FlgM
MDIRSSLDGLKSLLGVSPAATGATAATQAKSSTTASSASGLGSDSATLSSAGSEVSLTAADDGVRTDKVATIQAALVSGTYNVPATDVASKVVDAMLVSER